MSKQVLIMPLPPGALGAYSLAGSSGALNATLGVNDLLFAFRWTDPTRYAVLQHFSVWVSIATAVATAVATGFDLFSFYDYFSRHVGGVNLSADLATNTEGKLNSQFPASLVDDIRIAGAIPLELPLLPAAMNNQALANLTFGTGTAAGSTPVQRTVLFERSTNDYPFVMNQFEGFGLRMNATGPAFTSVGANQLRIGVNIKWLEMAKQTF